MQETYELVQEGCGDSVHTEGTGRASGLHGLVKTSEARKLEGVVRDGTNGRVTSAISSKPSKMKEAAYPMIQYARAWYMASAK